MFTGLIEETGTIKSYKKLKNGGILSVSCKTVLGDTSKGDSIAVNGVCLTVTSKAKDVLDFDVSDETLNLTSLKNSSPGTRVNLERALQLNSRLGGHIVQGHVDCTTTVDSIKKTGEFYEIAFLTPHSAGKHMALKGSVAIDGISLTISKLSDKSFAIAVIPETYAKTIMHTYKRGTTVNIETDILAKYVENMLNGKDSNEGLTTEKLQKLGY